MTRSLKAVAAQVAWHYVELAAEKGAGSGVWLERGRVGIGCSMGCHSLILAWTCLVSFTPAPITYYH